MVGGVLEKTKSVFSEIDGSSHHADFKDVSAEAPSTSLSIDSSRSNYRSASEDDTKETLMSVLKENSKKKERSKKKTTGKKTTKESQEEIVPPPEEINLNAMVSVTESTERVSSISDVNTIASFRSSSGSLSNKIDGGSSLSFDARSARGLFSKRSLQSEISQRLLSTSDFNLKNNKNIQELTINKLHYENIGHRERENELSTLQNCLDRLLSDEYDKKKELIWIKGQSGVGKTMLAKTLESRIAKMKGAISGYGSFDFNAADDNCSGIAAAFGEICHGIKKVKNFIAADLGLEAFLLSKLIPELNVLLPSIIRSSSSETERFDFRAGKEQWKHAFRVLLRTFNSYLSPMVLVLDDVQWADTSSLEVIEYLISDTDNANDLMIVCCYRPNEVAYVDVLSKIQDLSAMKSSSMYNLTALELGNFQLEMVNKVIMAMLSIDDEERTMGLTKICYKRTLGNPFFLIEFVTMLEEEELLTFNLGLLKWIWDERVIEDATMSTENIVSLVLARMEKVSEDAQLLMQYAACLGTSFKVSTLELIWRNHIPSTFLESKMVDLKTMLANLVDGNFIERCEKNDYRWVHNKVKEAALTFGDASNASFQFEIGTILFHSLSDKQLEESLFDVVDLINKGNVERRPNLAELNLRAAEKATLVSAFQSASTYVANGIKLLPQERWRLYRTTTLRLYTLGTEIEASLGRMDAMEKYSNEVLCRNDISILEKIPLYLAQTYRLCSVEMRYGKLLPLPRDLLSEEHELTFLISF
jgi:predicted ATPase